MNRLRQLRKEMRMSQKELADHFNIKQNTVSNWENNIRKIDAGMLTRISEYFDVSIDYLLCRTDACSGIKLDDLQFALYTEMGKLTREDIGKVLEYAKFIGTQKNKSD